MNFYVIVKSENVMFMQMNVLQSFISVHLNNITNDCIKERVFY
jgi:hypothetical protein